MEFQFWPALAGALGGLSFLLICGWWKCASEKRYSDIDSLVLRQSLEDEKGRRKSDTDSLRQSLKVVREERDTLKTHLTRIRSAVR